MTTADIGPIERAAELTALIEQRRREVTDLIGQRRSALDEARMLAAVTVAEIAEHVRLSRGRVSQITNRRRGRQESGVVAAGRARPNVQTAAPDNSTLAAEEAS